MFFVFLQFFSNFLLFVLEEIVALKRLKMEKEREGFPITSLREINTLLKAQHPNIVTVRVSDITVDWHTKKPSSREKFVTGKCFITLTKNFQGHLAGFCSWNDQVRKNYI